MLMQSFMQARAHQQCRAQHQRDKSAHAVPAVVMPEHPAESPGNAGTEIVTEPVSYTHLTLPTIA